jgi:hypothetical protein
LQATAEPMSIKLRENSLKVGILKN